MIPSEKLAKLCAPASAPEVYKAHKGSKAAKLGEVFR